MRTRWLPSLLSLTLLLALLPGAALAAPPPAVPPEEETPVPQEASEQAAPEAEDAGGALGRLEFDGTRCIPQEAVVEGNVFTFSPYEYIVDAVELDSTSAGAPPNVTYALNTDLPQDQLFGYTYKISSSDPTAVDVKFQSQSSSSYPSWECPVAKEVQLVFKIGRKGSATITIDLYQYGKKLATLYELPIQLVGNYDLTVEETSYSHHYRYPIYYGGDTVSLHVSCESETGKMPARYIWNVDTKTTRQTGWTAAAGVSDPEGTGQDISWTCPDSVNDTTLVRFTCIPTGSQPGSSSVYWLRKEFCIALLPPEEGAGTSYAALLQNCGGGAVLLYMTPFWDGPNLDAADNAAYHFVVLWSNPTMQRSAKIYLTSSDPEVASFRKNDLQATTDTIGGGGDAYLTTTLYFNGTGVFYLNATAWDGSVSTPLFSARIQVWGVNSTLTLETPSWTGDRGGQVITYRASSTGATPSEYRWTFERSPSGAEPWEAAECSYTTSRKGAVLSWTLPYLSADTYYRVTCTPVINGRERTDIQKSHIYHVRAVLTSTELPAQNGTLKLAAATGKLDPGEKGDLRISISGSTGSLREPHVLWTVTDPGIALIVNRAAAFDSPAAVAATPVTFVQDPAITITALRSGYTTITAQLISGFTQSGEYVNIGQPVAFRLTVSGAQAASHTVSFDSGGGSGYMAGASGVSGLWHLPPCTFTPPAGMTFAGWSLTRGGEAIQSDAITVNQSLTLYAVWQPERREVGPGVYLTVDRANRTLRVRGYCDQRHGHLKCVGALALYAENGRMIRCVMGEVDYSRGYAELSSAWTGADVPVCGTFFVWRENCPQQEARSFTLSL